MQANLRQEHSKLEKQIEGLMDRIVETDNISVIATYEKRIATMDRKRLVLVEKLQNQGKPKHHLDEMFEHDAISLQSQASSGKAAISLNKEWS